MSAQFCHFTLDYFCSPLESRHVNALADQSMASIGDQTHFFGRQTPTMYGLFHVAIRDMVCFQLNEATWREVIKRTSFDDRHFLTMKNYDDSVTQQLVQAATAVLGVTADRFMEKLGVFFIGDFSSALRRSLTMGTRPGFEEALMNLPAYIGTVSNAFQRFTTSGFEVTRLDVDAFRLDYRSARPGMEYFIKGMVIGMAGLYEESVKVVVSRPEPDQEECPTQFFITLGVDQQ